MKTGLILSLCLLASAATGCDVGGNQKNAATFVATTSDGWVISVQRFEPARVEPERMPVVLCHGLSYNDCFWNLSSEVSLARYLQQAGYDVWVPALRGAGFSTKPPLSRLRQAFRGDWLTMGGMFTSGGAGILKINWTVDDHIQHDVPTILDLVTRQTKRPRVHWVGHSMGGMILVGHLCQKPDEERLASFVALGVPVFISQPVSAPMEHMAKGRNVMEVSNLIVSTNLPAILGALGGGSLSTPIDVLFYNRANVTDLTIRQLNVLATEDISPGQLAQLIDMISSGKFASADGKTDYTANLEKARPPGLFVCGTVDNLATVDAVKTLYNRWGGAPKEFRMFGVVNGQGTDYGHDDLVIGKNARQDVYPVIRKWLDERGPARPLISLPDFTGKKS